MTSARLANHRNPHIAILALALLDTLVQSCGYPFHLQISTKEFLNELVRRFPERPPPFPGPVMSRILDLIHGWKEGICTESRWREDLGNIRDMHRLLTFKGYRFRDANRRHQPTVDVSTVRPFECSWFHISKTTIESEIGGGTGRGRPGGPIREAARTHKTRDPARSRRCSGTYEIPGWGQPGCEARLPHPSLDRPK